MGRRQTDLELGRCALLILFVMGMISCSFVYFCLSVLFRPPPNSNTFSLGSNVHRNVGDLIGNEEGEEECCGGIENLELWGDAVRWGSDFKVNSSRECCMACKEMCGRERGSCLCDTWVFCGDRGACGPRFGECWLKKQKDTLDPQLHDSGDKVIWTSGQIFGKGEGIIGLETEHGMLRIKLLPFCAPHSVAYILELLASRLCAGCRFYRAESRGDFWDSEGNHVGQASYGPPFALIQGTLEAYGTEFKEIPSESSQAIRRGSVAWVDSGPEFFISLANHNEWRKAYTVFAHVLPQDMEIAEKITHLSTKSKVISNIPVSVLEKQVPFRFQRINTSP